MGDGRCAGLLVERSWFENWPGHSVVFLGKTFYCHSASTQECEWVRDDYQESLMKCWGLPWVGLVSHPGEKNNTVSRHRNQDKLWLGGSDNSNTDLT